MKRKPVPRPERTVIITQKKNRYVYYTQGVKYHKELKRSVPSRVLIGKLNEEGLLVPNAKYFEIFEDAIELLEPNDRSDVMHIGPSFIVHEISRRNELYPLLVDIFDEKASKIIDIATYMMMSENNVMQYFEDYGYDHTLLHGDNFTDSTICELFKNIQIKDIDTFIQAWVNLHVRKEIYISYDSTNMNNTSGNIELTEYGKAKENEELPQINLSLAYNQTDDIPLFYEIYPGSIVDIAECEKMVERAKRYGIQEIGFILDRGYFSKKNIRYFEENKYDYIIMAKSNVRFLKDILDEYGAVIRNGYSYYLKGYELYGMSVEKELFGSETKQYVHIYYDGMRAEQEKVGLNEYFSKCDEKLETLKNKKIKRQEDVEAYKKFYTLKFDENGYFLNYQRKEETIRKQIENTGVFIIITSKKMSAMEALDTYRDRDCVEKIFRMEKSYLGNDCFRVHDTMKLESKVFVSFVALILRNEIYKGMRPLYKKNKKEYTVPKVLRELDKLMITKLSDEKYHQRYALTKKQKEILKALGIPTENYERYVKEIKLLLNE